MALSYKARRRWALVILLVGLPLYVVAAVNVIDLFERPSFLVELADLLVQVLTLAQAMKLVRLGTMAVDGPQLKAKASPA